MTTTKILCAATLLLLCSCATKKEENGQAIVTASKYQLLVTQKSETDTSWGYIILSGDRQLIKQFTVPVLDGNRLFKNRQQAALVGGLVAAKLNSAQSPGITKKELDSLGITQSFTTNEKE